jgi:putative transferase (TIGR04331 family)
MPNDNELKLSDDKSRLFVTHSDHPIDDLQCVYLGPWCAQKVQKSNPYEENKHVLNHAPISLEERFKRNNFAEDVIEKLLPDLAAALNTVHQTQHAVQFWRICTGYWLSIFVDSVYERWLCASAVSETGDLYTLEESGQSLRSVISESTLSFNLLAQSSEWNRAVYETILRDFPNVEMLPATVDGTGTVPSVHAEPRRRTLSLLRAIESFSNTLSRFGAYSLCTTYLSRRQEMLLALSLRSFPRYWNSTKRFNNDSEKRNELRIKDDGESEFESFVRKILAQQIPKTFVEGFDAISKATQPKRIGRRPKVIFTSNLHLWNDEFSIWAAHQCENGSKLAISQHGGLNGQGLFPTRAEYHEGKISDCHLPWGWKSESEKTRNIPALINVGKKRFEDQSGAQKLLLITDCTYRYGRKPWVSTMDNDTYIGDLQGFVGQLTPDIRSNVVVRLHHHSALYDADHAERWSSFNPGIALDEGAVSMDKLRAQSRIAVCTTLGTSEIEQFGRNFPTLLMLNPLTHPIRSECQELFSLMKQVGLLHESPQAAAMHIDRIWTDTNRWWNQGDVQAVVKQYLARFGRKSDHPLREIRKTLKTISQS